MRKLAIFLLMFHWAIDWVHCKRINATCSWGEPNSGRIDPFSCYIRIPFKLTPNDTLNFNSEIEAAEIQEVNFWLPAKSRYQWDITFVPTIIFEKFTQLKSFTLPGRIENIASNDFENAANLLRLTIGNQLRVIPDNVFIRLTKLEVLNLSSNKITSVHENGLKGLTNLRVLKLSRNHLQKFRLRTFENTPQLEELILNNNQIETIEDGTLQLPHLKRLDLSHNKLKELSNNMFQNCRNLEHLDIRSNHITLIKRSLYHLNRLQYLNLDNNRIVDIYFRALARLQALEHLSLENNGQSLTDNIFVSEPSTGGVKSSVKYLFLSGNALKHREILVRLWALGLTHLEKLHLDNNAFEYIDFYPIDAFPKLEEINLGKNFWKCDWLEQTLQKLEADGIDVNLFSSRFPSATSYKHINFIPCI